MRHQRAIFLFLTVFFLFSCTCSSVYGDNNKIKISSNGSLVLENDYNSETYTWTLSTYNDKLSLGVDAAMGGNTPILIHHDTSLIEMAYDIKSLNKIAIGQHTPQAALHIKGRGLSGYPNSFAFFDTEASGFDCGIQFHESGTLRGQAYYDATLSAIRIENALHPHQLVLAGNGKVGIGTSTPEFLLHAAGDNPRLLLESTTTNSHAEINFKTPGTLNWDIYKDYTTGDLKFYQNGNKVTLKDSTGYVGIGTMDPQYQLDVMGDIRATGSVYYGGTYGSADGTAYNKPDYVFEKGYRILSTDQVAEHVEREGSLPWITSSKHEKQENGNKINMTRMSFETVETVENLQLQIIALSKLIKEQQEIVKKQQKQIEMLLAAH